MMNKVLLLLLIGATFMACDQTATTKDEAGTKVEEGSSDKYFGEKFNPENVLDYGELAAQVPQTDSVSVQVRGKVSAVCLKKGCWMNMVQQDGDAEMMVRFKDYGFFMPFDIAGDEVIVNGKAFYETIGVDELRHYAEDAGKSEEEIAAITEEEKELRFYADGVILVGGE